jgi:hypothetical protein
VLFCVDKEIFWGNKIYSKGCHVFKRIDESVKIYEYVDLMRKLLKGFLTKFVTK